MYLLVDNPETVDNLGMIVPAPISNDQQVLMRTLSHPPGFEPKVLPQPINQGNQAGYTGYPAERLQTQMPDALHIPMSHAQPTPTYKGSNIHQMASHNEGSLIPVSASNSTLSTQHHTYQGYMAPSHTVISHGGAQIVPPVTPATPQAYIPYGTVHHNCQIMHNHLFMLFITIIMLTYQRNHKKKST